jgi:MFS family permease
MVDISKYDFLKYPLFGSLYFSEGLKHIIATIILPIYLADVGIPIALIGIVSSIFLMPMTIKFFWGGIVDHWIKFGRRRFIIIGGLLSIVGLFIVSFIDPSEFLIMFSIFLFIAGVGVGFLDVSADAWAIEISKENERGKINGAMFAGQSLGMLIGAPLLTTIAYIYNYQYVFLITSLIVLFIIAFPILIKDDKKIRKRQKLPSILLKEFKKKTTLLVSLFTPLSAINIGLLGIVIPLHLKINLNMDITQIGWVIMLWAGTKIIGSLIAGTACDKIGRKFVLYIVMTAGVILTAMLIFANSWETIAILYTLIGFMHGGQYTALGALLMDVTNPKVGATQFSILTSLGNIGLFSGEFLSGAMYSILGFARTFLYGAWFYGPAILVLYIIKLKFKK